MDTTTSIIITQVPIAIGILIGAWELHQTRKELIRVLERLKNQ